MVHCENVSDVEVAREELFVVLNLVQEVREVRVLALLLEWASNILKMVLLVVDLLSSALIERFEGQTFHVLGIHLACAIGIFE